MKARMPAGFGRPDMNALMRQAQKMQEDMKAKQAELEAAEYTGSAAGEMVTVKMNGKHEVLSITIKPEAVDPDDVEMLEDMVAAAINATVKQVDETAEAEMGKLTGGMNIPGKFRPRGRESARRRLRPRAFRARRPALQSCG